MSMRHRSDPQLWDRPVPAKGKLGLWELQLDWELEPVDQGLSGHRATRTKAGYLARRILVEKARSARRHDPKGAARGATTRGAAAPRDRRRATRGRRPGAAGRGGACGGLGAT